MIDFFDISYYTPAFFYILMILVLITTIHTYFNNGYSTKTYLFNKTFSYLLLFFLLIYIGLRPVSYYFGDMGNYAKYFDLFESTNKLSIKNDIGFYLLMYLFYIFGTKITFFFTCSLLYILPLYIASIRLSKKYYFFIFLSLVTSLLFWQFGVNGIRNGIATSLFLLAITLNNKVNKYFLFIIATSFHSSTLLLIFAYFVSEYSNKKYLFYYLWALSILLSLLMGSFWENFFLNLGFGVEDRLNDYFTNKEQYRELFSHVGFRWDFLLYSSFPVFISFYFIYKKKFYDILYLRFVKIYLITNAFWILVIRANFSSRFAYLSWFLMGILIIYPLLKIKYWKKQFFFIGKLLFAYFLFTFIMQIIIKI